MTFVSKYHTLKVGCVGAVSTHPEYRNRGYFTSVISKVIKYAKSHDFDLLFLGGNRFRYNHFGFENAGRNKDVVLYNCTSGYPVPFENVCLLEIKRIKDAYGDIVKEIGFSAAAIMGFIWQTNNF